MYLVYIHGHGASKNSFNFIQSEVRGHKEIYLEYNSKDGFESNLSMMYRALKDVDEIFFIAHSMGGLYALHLADALGSKVVGAVTMATPYGGSVAALLLKAMFMLDPQQIYADIHPHARPIVSGLAIDLSNHYHWVAIVTTGGHSHLMTTPNDGVVTHASMRNRKDVRFVDVCTTHSEVIQSRVSVTVILETIAEIENLLLSTSQAIAA